MTASLRSLVRAALALGLLAALCGTARAEKPLVVWARTDFPPFFILEGPLKDQGVYDASLPRLFALLDGFEHAVRPMSIARSLEMMAAQENHCNMALTRTAERERSVVFSQPVTRIFRNELIVRRDDLPRFRPWLQNGMLDLDGLLAARGVSLAIIRGRRYGEAIDPVLARHAAAADQETVSQSGQALRMLLSGRVDAAIAFPQEAAYAIRTGGPNLRPDALASLPIRGVEAMPGYVGCSDTPLGRRVIAAVNTPAVREVLRARFTAAAATWNDPNLRP